MLFREMLAVILVVVLAASGVLVIVFIAVVLVLAVMLHYLSGLSSHHNVSYIARKRLGYSKQGQGAIRLRAPCTPSRAP